MNNASYESSILLEGDVGPIEVFISEPASMLPKALVIICHPHPLFGGTPNNKVVTTLAKTFLEDLGCVVLRPSFRGVGQTAGTHDQGKGEVNDVQKVLEYALAHYLSEDQTALPVVLAGFSFGAYVQALLLKLTSLPIHQFLAVAPAIGKIDDRVYDYPALPTGALVIHGDEDEVVSFEHVLKWAKEHDQLIQLIPGAGHFFHRKLHMLRRVVLQQWKKP